MRDHIVGQRGKNTLVIGGIFFVDTEGAQFSREEKRVGLTNRHAGMNSIAHEF
jgi:hypothetical protein